MNLPNYSASEISMPLFQILHAIYSQFSSLTSRISRERPNPEWSFENGLFSGLKSYYPSTKDECEGV